MVTCLFWATCEKVMSSSDWPMMKVPPGISTIPCGARLVLRCARLTPTSSDRKSVVEGKSVSVSVDIGGRRIMKKKKNQRQATNRSDTQNESKKTELKRDMCN